MVDLITGHATRHFSATPCSPCATSSICFTRTDISDENVSIVESFHHSKEARSRASSFTSIPNTITKDRHRFRKRSASMDSHVWNEFAGAEKTIHFASRGERLVTLESKLL